jgi:hypothetical protein
MHDHHDHHETPDFVCLFCGFSRGPDDPITVAAIWTEDGKQREQYWGAHRACLIEHMSEPVRELGGPLTRD